MPRTRKLARWARRQGSVLTLVVVAVLVFALLEAKDFPSRQARMFPFAIGVPTLALATVQLGIDLFRTTSGKPKAQIMDLAFETDLDAGTVARRTFLSFVWVGGFFAATYLVGMRAAVVVFVPLYLLLHARARWYAALAGAVATWILVVTVFDQFLGIAVPRGVFPLL